jgi:hypothetical protein
MKSELFHKWSTILFQECGRKWNQNLFRQEFTLGNKYITICGSEVLLNERFFKQLNKSHKLKDGIFKELLTKLQLIFLTETAINFSFTVG